MLELFTYMCLAVPEIDNNACSKSIEATYRNSIAEKLYQDGVEKVKPYQKYGTPFAMVYRFNSNRSTKIRLNETYTIEASKNTALLQMKIGL